MKSANERFVKESSVISRERIPSSKRAGKMEYLVIDWMRY